MNETFGKYVRQRRVELAKQRGGFSVRKLAAMLDIQPSYISKIEREEVKPPSEETIIRLAKVLEVDADVLLALAGKVSAEVRSIILKRPQLFADLLRQIKDAPEHAILQVVREVREFTM
jgi:transcriptional regulator with XRE-family HTH domain